MSDPLDRNALDTAIKLAVYTSIEQILTPLVEQWHKDIDRNLDSRYVAGLEKALSDVQSIIDRGNERKKALHS